MNIFNWFRKFLQYCYCDHDWKFVANIYGDQINACNGKRSIWKCQKCGKIKYGDYLYINDLCDELEKLYDEYYNKRYKEWKLLRSKTLNKMQADMINLAYNGECWYDIVLMCEEENNDRNYYEKWFIENNLRIEEVELFNQKEKFDKRNQYKFQISWK